MNSRSLLFSAFILLALSACSLADDITPPPGYESPVPEPTLGALFPGQVPDLAVGAAIYVEKCAPCHGPQGLGDGPQAAKLPKQPTALGNREIARAAIPAAWYTVVTEGRIDNFMPPFTSLTDQERWDVVAYSLSLSTAVDEMAQGQVVYQANCADCHGDAGNKSAQSDFTDQARMAKLSLNDLLIFIDQGVDGVMPGFAGQLSESDRYAVASHLRSFAWTSTGAGDATPAPDVTKSAIDLTTTPASSEPVVTPSGNDTTEMPGTIIGVIGGKITNKSGGSVPDDLKAVLHVFEHGSASNQFVEISMQETSVGIDGSYSFDNVPMPASQVFYVSVDYADTSYDSDPAVPTAGQTVYDLPVTIYDTTTDRSALVADQVHILLDYSKPDIIQVVQFYVISNPGTKTVIPAVPGAPIVTVGLPKGYANLQFQDGQLGERYVQTADGFGDTFPVTPSEKQYQLVFAFDLPSSASFDFIEPFSLDVSSITFLVSEGVTASGANLVDGGLRDMGNGGGTYQLYTVAGHKAGESLKVSVSGKPNQAVSAPITGTDSTAGIIIGVGALGLALIVAGGWLFWRNRQHTPIAETLIDEESTDEILDAIIALDDQYNAGNIGDEAYRQRRAELKERFKRVENRE